MDYQEQEFLQEIFLETLKLFAMIHLNSTPSPDAAATTTTPPPATRSPVSITTRSSKKRRSPFSSLSPFQKKLFTKRTALPPPTTNTTTSPAADANANFPSPPLQRSSSEPIYFFRNALIPEASTGEVLNSLITESTQLPNSLSPENSSKNDGTMSKSPSLPPLPPPLRRTSSAPIPSDDQVVPLTAITACTPAATGEIPISSSSDQERPDSKRLKKMKDKMQELTEWCYQVMREGDETTATEYDCKKTDYESAGCEADHEAQTVWIEENVGGLVIHFKCPCGKIYDVLLSGNNCYYKLT